MKKFFKEFKEFINRGNVLDMAVGVIIGGAFSAIVTALTNKIIMPLINLLLSTGGDGLESARTILSAVYTTDAAGNEVIDWASSIYIDWGAFITAILDFILIAFVLFMLIKFIMKSKGFLEEKIKLSKEQLRALKEKGVNVKDKEAVKVALEEEQTEVVVEETPKEETEAELLKEIRDLLKANSKSETKE